MSKRCPPGYKPTFNKTRTRVTCVPTKKQPSPRLRLANARPVASRLSSAATAAQQAGSQPAPVSEPNPKTRHICVANYENESFIGYVNNDKCHFVYNDSNARVPMSTTEFNLLHNNNSYRWSPELPTHNQRVYAQLSPANKQYRFSCRARDPNTNQYYTGYSTDKPIHINSPYVGYSNTDDLACQVVDDTGEVRTMRNQIVKDEQQQDVEYKVEYLTNQDILNDGKAEWVKPTEGQQFTGSNICRYKDNLGFVYRYSSDGKKFVGSNNCVIFDGSKSFAVPINVENNGADNFEYLKGSNTPNLMKPTKDLRIYNKDKYLCRSPYGPDIGEYDESDQTCKGVSRVDVSTDETNPQYEAVAIAETNPADILFLSNRVNAPRWIPQGYISEASKFDAMI